VTDLLAHFAWPLALLLLGVVAIFAFRAPLSRLLDRTGGLSVTKDGLNIAAAAAASAQTESNPVERGLEIKSEASKELDVARRPNISPLLRELEGRIRADLTKFNLDGKPKEATDLLIEHLATSQLLHGAERLYRLIFGSQLLVLKHLDLHGSITQEQLRTVYDAARSQYPEIYDKYSFASWMAFLKINGLVLTSDDVNYSITVVGKSFLQWLVANGISEVKAF
jgi:hypothetical protein